MNENVDNLRLKNQSLNFNDDLTKTLKKIFWDIYNDFGELLFFKNNKNTSSITSHI